ncbi:hypothetical protein M422DRAFT_254343 [Sphaerobolus stellatus SS14]|uniref:Unplaced genomic scaffold SPHSTscaffold_54, whole genome shotgun sequence n=1 Tax=Sphaerobolus stellatus (strain SS14) TaxID=990650 RepID=A0A0C9V6F3_SPHS4|nr:hypothetical protein M422DRAFT_254343 [Sphaerobolus stellatus SS14]
MTSENLRPWEVALLSLCGNENRRYRKPVTKPTGLPTLILAMEKLMHPIRLEDQGWGSMILVLRSLAFISAYAWTSEYEITGQMLVVALAKLLSEDLYLRNVPAHYWATDTLRNIVSHHRHYLGLLRALHIENRITLVIRPSQSPFVSPNLTSIPLPDVDSPATTASLRPQRFSIRNVFRRNSIPDQDGSRHRRRASNSSTMSGASARDMLKADGYTQAAMERAEELERWLNDAEAQEHGPLPKVVSMAGPQSWGMLSTFLSMTPVTEENEV